VRFSGNESEAAVIARRESAASLAQDSLKIL
jgi:hypothetical protein